MGDGAGLVLLGCRRGAGRLLGGLFPFDTKGLDFVMTAMFVVIFVDNFLKEKQHWSSLIGIAGGTIVYMLLVQMM